MSFCILKYSILEVGMKLIFYEANSWYDYIPPNTMYRKYAQNWQNHIIFKINASRTNFWGCCLWVLESQVTFDIHIQIINANSFSKVISYNCLLRSHHIPEPSGDCKVIDIKQVTRHNIAKQSQQKIYKLTNNWKKTRLFFYRSSMFE